jgi:hypothetical protein
VLKARQYGDHIALRWDGTQHKHILAAAVVTFRSHLADRSLGMQDNLLMVGAHQMVHDSDAEMLPQEIRSHSPFEQKKQMLGNV